jgi:hypothetical protein
MSTLFIPWDSHQQMVIADSGPRIAKEVTSGTFAYCPVCRAFPQTKMKPDAIGSIASEIGSIKCTCHEATAKIAER